MRRGRKVSTLPSASQIFHLGGGSIGARRLDGPVSRISEAAMSACPSGVNQTGYSRAEAEWPVLGSGTTENCTAQSGDIIVHGPGEERPDSGRCLRPMPQAWSLAPVLAGGRSWKQSLPGWTVGSCGRWEKETSSVQPTERRVTGICVRDALDGSEELVASRCTDESVYCCQRVIDGRDDLAV